ncbi:MAG: hypothetical protein U9Q21_00285 [Candidatus Auribacterota bacterium]|nr:hypothetical protein [Candidatus Auribacterota bacterium]
MRLEGIYDWDEPTYDEEREEYFVKLYYDEDEGNEFDEIDMYFSTEYRAESFYQYLYILLKGGTNAS